MVAKCCRNCDNWDILLRFACLNAYCKVRHVYVGFDFYCVKYSGKVK